MDGWVKLHRKILENPVTCKDGDYFAIWCYLLLNATHKEQSKIFGSEKIILMPGQLITGRKVIASQFNISESKVQRVLKTLESEQQIEQQTSNKNRLISVLNWEQYQQSEQQVEQQLNNKRTTTEQQVNTNKNERMKECKNDNKEESTSSEFEHLIIAWNNLNLSKIVSIKNNRLKMLNARIKENGIDEVLRAISNINESSFLRGQNDRNWAITFDWFVKPNNFIKVLEGNYKDKEKENKVQTKTSKGNFTNYEQRNYDFEDLEKKLLGWGE